VDRREDGLLVRGYIYGGGGVELLSFDQAQPRVGKPLPAAMSAVGEGTARNFQSAVRAGLRTFLPPVESRAEAPRDFRGSTCFSANGLLSVASPPDDDRRSYRV